MAAKTIVMTGGTSGIGLAAALAFARQGHRLVLVARDPARAEAALRQVRRAGPEVEHALHLADLSRLGEMKRVGSAIAEAEPRIDVLVNNAGAWFPERVVTEGGFEKTFALDHLSYFVLTDALLPALKAAAPSRIVSTSSDGHRFAGMAWDDLQGERRYSSLMAYCRAKLCNVLFTRELARRLAGTGVDATCFHPGFVATRFGDESSGFGRAAFAFGKSLFAVTPEKGAETLVHLATSPDVAGQSGGYYAKMKETKPNAAGRDDAAARRLWTATAEMTGVGT